MLTYWLMYLYPAMMALLLNQRKQRNIVPWLFFGFFFVLLIGFREKVGGDWGNYLHHYYAIVGRSLDEVLGKKEPGHVFLNWLSARWDLGVYGTNAIYGLIFMIGLIKLSRSLLYPWIAATVATPYLVVVVAMGYSRQAVAIGFFMLAISYLGKGKFKTYIFLVLMATLFHRTAVLLIPFGVFAYGKGKWLKISMIIPIAYGAWGLMLADTQSQLWSTYVDMQMQSSGAKIRVLMSFVAAMIFFYYRKKWKKYFNDYLFWLWISIAVVLSLVLVNFASTAVDRIALYFIPLQLVVYARLPYLASNSSLKTVIVFGYALVLFVWLTFGTFSMWWLPYQNILFMRLF